MSAMSTPVSQPMGAGTTVLAKQLEVALLTGGFDRPYAFGLAMALASREVSLEIIGSDEIDSPEMHVTAGLHFLKLLRNARTNSPRYARLGQMLLYYVRLARYAACAKPRVFHILWNNRFQTVDRTLLMMYYKALGKRIVLTVHNVNAGQRDSNDSVLNRMTLRAQYRLSDHLFVHTEKMKCELVKQFGVAERAVSVIPFGINNSVPNTELTASEAKRKLGIGEAERSILFFGAIRPYKGLSYLADAFVSVAGRDPRYKLIIAGEPKAGAEDYVGEVDRKLSALPKAAVLRRMQHIPDEETELYFKAADLLVLPYTHIFQSGVLVLAYSFGLPVVASDVGCFREDVVAGETGYLCEPCDAASLAQAIDRYFASDLFTELRDRRQGIQDYAVARFSWNVVAEKTRTVYQDVEGGRR
jgi:glycosyltransferase involved in cell wall biosynthesis